MNEYVKSRMEQLKHTVDLIKGSITEPWDLALYTWRVSNESKNPEDIAAYEEAKAAAKAAEATTEAEKTEDETIEG